jgi:hypothetical protein
MPRLTPEPRPVLDPRTLKDLVDAELAQVSDARVLADIGRLRIEPRPFAGRWNFTRARRYHPCWAILQNERGHGVAYCASGFGPSLPWGLMRLSGDSWMGMDSDWLPTLLDAYFGSLGDEIPIWRVLMRRPGEPPRFITAEASWDETWQRVYELRASDPAARYDCDHGIAYASPYRTDEEPALT